MKKRMSVTLVTVLWLILCAVSAALMSRVLFFIPDTWRWTTIRQDIGVHGSTVYTFRMVASLILGISLGSYAVKKFLSRGKQPSGRDPLTGYGYGCGTVLLVLAVATVIMVPVTRMIGSYGKPVLFSTGIEYFFLWAALIFAGFIMVNVACIVAGRGSLGRKGGPSGSDSIRPRIFRDMGEITEYCMNSGLGDWAGRIMDISSSSLSQQEKIARLRELFTRLYTEGKIKDSKVLSRLEKILRQM